MTQHQVDAMFTTQFAEALLKEVTDDMDNDEDCLFKADTDDAYSELGLLTPPWSPSDSSAMDTDAVCESFTAAVESALCATTTRARSDSFLCSCTSCECSGSQRADGPVLRDCMWSQTTGLLPPPSLVARQTSDDSTDTDSGADCRQPCCPAITAACTNHTDRCVDPRNVFPCQAVLAKSLCTTITLPRSQTQTVVVTPDCSFTKSPVYDPDSETSAYCSSFSDDELEEIDVVSVASCNEVQSLEPPPLPVRRQVLVLPAAESMSAQVAAMHNYSNPRCRPTPATARSNVLSSVPYTTKCSNMRKSGRAVRPRRHPRRITASSAVSSPASMSDSSSDSGVQEDERHKRAQHNVMERQRRYNLKSHFYNLRDVVPGTRGESRVSKVSILSRAVDHIRQLNATNAALLSEQSRLRAVQERWKWKLSLVNRDARHAAVCSA